MWKVLIIGAILVLLTAYMKYKSAARSRRGQGSWVERFVAAPPGVICCASVVLVVIGAALWLTEFGSRAEQRQRLAEELAWRRLLAAQLGASLAQQLPAELAAKGTPKALVIDLQLPGTSDEYHQALVAGLEQGFGGKVTLGAAEWVTLPAGKDASEEALTRATQLTNQQLDGWVEKNADCQVVVSLVGLPPNYGRSMTMDKTRSGRLVLGVYTPSVYMLGGAIQHKGVTACVVPKGSYLDEGKLPDLAQPEAAFSQRYVLVHAANLAETLKSEKRMFRMR